MFAVLHVLLNSSALLNPIQSYHPHLHQYIDMQPFAMHCLQGCRGSFKSWRKILGVSCPPLLHWCSQFCMCCSTTRHWRIHCRVISSLFTWILTLTYSHIHVNTYPCKTLICSLVYIYPCKTYTDLKSHFPMSTCSWMLHHFPNNYRRERDSDESEYYAGLQWEWEFRMNKSNALHNDLVWLEAPLVDRISLTLPRSNMH